ncbi:MAG: hsp70 family protein [Deltaproteobacteria bacterium]|nr:hsp70 family protein [Deltaproteobacteria bacterium]
MGEPRYVVGIDLGTTNTVAAYADASGGPVHDLPVPQTVAPHEVQSRAQLPSAIYLAAKGELPAAAARLPWDEAPKHATFIGAFARAQGQKVPGRVVTSAKSWLCVPAVERTAAILPWAAADDVERLSPVDAEALVLAHVARAFEHATGAPLAEQDLTITVPASFDEVARELTVSAAGKAGLAHARLLEEPQAALYAFLRAHERALAADLAGVRLVLVVDVGGGTTDLTLVSVTLPAHDGAPPALERIAVGDHLMLGGDNMDITLARHVERALTGTVGGLDATSWGALVESARAAKELLLGDAPPEHTPVALATRGSKLVGGTKTAQLSRADAEALLLDGFLPKTAADDVARRGARTALTELGLPFEKEPAITRHVAGFLRRHAEAAAAAGARVVGGLARPDAVLLNGGVFKSPAIRKRLLEALAAWAGGEVPLLGGVLHGDALDLAVARGAAQYGLVRRGKGLRIGGGSPRAYFVGVGDQAGVARGQSRALCVVPKGLHEGERIEVDRTFRLVLDRPVGFPLFTSTSSSAKAGELVDVGPDLERLPPLSAVLASESEAPVRVSAYFSEVGTLDLSLHMTPEALRRFSLSFSTRAQGGEDATGATSAPQRAESVHRRLEEGRELILQFYGSKNKGVDPKRVKDLRRELEKLFGERDTWSMGLNRELCGTLLGGARNRRRTVEHERVFFQLVGFTLRPGVGAPFDDWRLEQLWPLWREGVQHTSEKPTWASWWILWRRVAAGLSVERQRELGAYLKPWLLEQGTGKKGEGPTPHGQDEMVRLVASLERLPASDKVELGAFVHKKIGRGGVSTYWPLGRLGARHLLAGSAHDVVPAAVASEWAEKILNADLKTAEGAQFALAQLARVTGDRTRDLEEPLRRRIAERLAAAGAPAHLVRMVRERVEWTADDEAQAFGEALPPGLRL